MKRTIDLDQVRVVQADDYKGNPGVYLEIMDTRVLYSDPWTLLRDERWAWTVKTETYGEPPFERHEHIVDTEALADVFRSRLGVILARLLLDDDPFLGEAWSTSADREIDYVKPRLDEEQD